MTTASARVAVAAPNDLSASAGTRLAAEGGNAIDAALAAVLVTMVSEPGLVSLASGGYLTIQPPDGSAPVTIDGWVDMPGRGLPAERFGRAVWDVRTPYGGDTTMTVGHGSVATPGTLKAVERAHQRFGRVPWAQVLAPAIAAARDGFPLNQASHAYLEYVHLEIFGWQPESYAVLHDADGTLVPRGSTVRVPDLAASLQQIAVEGSDAFYTGDIAKLMADDLEAHGGILTLDDLAAYEVAERPALTVRQGGWQLATNPGPAMGGVCMSALLAMCDGRPARGSWSPDELAHLVRSQHAVFGIGINRHDDEDARLGLARELLNRSLGSASTAHVSTVDDDGGACAVTVSAGYGSGVLSPGTGIWLNNCLGEQELVLNGVHALQPGTRLNSNMAPTVGRRERDGAALAIGSPGSDRIVTAVAQVLALHLNGGLDLAAAIAHPRVHVRVRDGQDPPVRIDHEADLRLPAGLSDELGLPTRSMDTHAMYFGGVGAAQWEPGGGLTAAGDPRRTGSVAVTGSNQAHST
ncbi:MAG: gamma-glutamyltransferase [Nocardioidaceae bacterium]|nr:gamma-glutamyltransferase [Nocardioidaceae bacterium]